MEMEANRSDEEYHFRRLYFAYICRVLENENYNFDELRERIKSLRSAFNFREGGKGMKEIDMNHNLSAYAYLGRYGLMSTGLVRQRILEAFAGCADLFSHIKRPKLQVLDLGSGPGTDVVGFCSALYETGISECKQIDFTLVDYTKSWEHMSQDLEALIRKYNYGFASKLFQTKKISMEFLLMDLNSDPEENETFLNKLMNADIILVTRLLQDLDDIYEFFENIHSCMKPDALVVVIDSSWYVQEEQGIFKLVYKHPIEDGEGRPPHNFRLLAWGSQGEPYSDQIAVESNNKIFVFKMKESEDTGITADAGESSK